MPITSPNRRDDWKPPGNGEGSGCLNVVGAAFLALIAVLALLLAGCGAQAGQHGNPSPTKAKATQAPPPPPPAVAGGQPPAHPQANRPGPEADPNNCNATGERDIELQAWWYAENDEVPNIAYVKNHEFHQATNLLSHHLPDGRKGYTGDWDTFIRAKCMDVISIELKGALKATGCGVAIIDLGDGPVKTGERNCKATYTVV